MTGAVNQAELRRTSEEVAQISKRTTVVEKAVEGRTGDSMEDDL